MIRCCCTMVLTALALGLFACAGLAEDTTASSDQDSLSSLIDLLTEKDVITDEEQDSLKERVAKAERPAAPSP
ncbi:MAG: hypothetical protein JSV79_04280, partial [Armatimonadota bacterium]